MGEEDRVPEPEAAGQGETSEDATAWRDVLARLDALGGAVSRWARAATNDPENRRRAQELKDHVNRVAREVGETVDGVAKSEIGQTLKEAAGKAGDAFRVASGRIGDEVAPRMAGAFHTVADSLHDAATRMEERARADAAAETAADRPTAPSGDGRSDAEEPDGSGSATPSDP